MHSNESAVLGVAGLLTATMPAFGAAVSTFQEEGLSTSSAIIIGVVLTGITVPLLKWVLGRLDRSLHAQQEFNKQQSKNNENTTKLLGMLISEQKERRREGLLHHEEMMDRIDSLESMMGGGGEDEQRGVPPEAPKEH